MSQQPIRICFVCTHSLTLTTLYKGLFPYLARHGYEIEVVVGDSEYPLDPKHFGEIRPHIVPMTRMPHPLKDPVALARMFRFLRAGKFDIVHVSTPKAGLLGSIAARIVGARVIFVYRRCVYEMMGGLKRAIFRQNDRIICALSDEVLPISSQIRTFLLKERLVSPGKIRMIGSGSSNGIDVRRFNPRNISDDRVAELRSSLSISPDAPILLYLGRVSSEKGVDLLPELLDRVRQRHPTTVMVVAGPEDKRDPPSERTKEIFATHEAICRIGYVADPSPLFALADLFVFPSYFEGFGNVLLEAAAHERVAIGFDVPGVQEAIAHRESGVLVAKGDVAAMSEEAIALLADPEARRAMALRARARVENIFSNEVIWAELDRTFRDLMAERTVRRVGDQSLMEPAE